MEFESLRRRGWRRWVFGGKRAGVTLASNPHHTRTPQPPPASRLGFGLGAWGCSACACGAQRLPYMDSSSRAASWALETARSSAPPSPAPVDRRLRQNARAVRSSNLRVGAAVGRKGEQEKRRSPGVSQGQTRGARGWRGRTRRIGGGPPTPQRSGRPPPPRSPPAPRCAQGRGMSPRSGRRGEGWRSCGGRRRIARRGSGRCAPPSRARPRRGWRSAPCSA